MSSVCRFARTPSANLSDIPLTLNLNSPQRRLIALRMEGKFPPVWVSGGAWRIQRSSVVPLHESVTGHYLERLITEVEAGSGPDWITLRAWPVFPATAIAAKVMREGLGKKGPGREYSLVDSYIRNA